MILLEIVVVASFTFSNGSVVLLSDTCAVCISEWIECEGVIFVQSFTHPPGVFQVN